MANYTTYYNEPLLKNYVVKQMAEHVENGTLVQGSYWDEKTQKGCNVGCVLHSYDFDSFPERLGLPVWMAYLHNKMHEGMTLEDAREFSKVYSVIPVDITWDQLEVVKYKLLRYIFVESKYCTKQYCTDDFSKEATDAVVALITRAIAGDMPTDKEWRAAADRAAANVSFTARDAAARTYYYAHYAATKSAAAADAADSAYGSYAATRSASMRDYARYYMRLLGEMKNETKTQVQRIMVFRQLARYLCNN
jgi:hypothetical protein